jgi:hypothetical protein
MLTAPDGARAFRTESHTRTRPRQLRLSRPINRAPVAGKKFLDADLNGDGVPDVVGGRVEASATVVLTGD